jgi:hypothetical protein
VDAFLRPPEARQPLSTNVVAADRTATTGSRILSRRPEVFARLQ